MGRGGAQRVTSIVANAWAQQGKRICILTWDGSVEISYELHPGITLINLFELSTQLDLDIGPARRLWRHRMDYLREIERALRPRWPWRKRRSSSAGSRERHSRFAGWTSNWTPSWISPRIYRRRSAAMLDSLTRHEGWLPPWIVSPSRVVLTRVLLGGRVRVFRYALKSMKAQVVVSMLVKTNVMLLHVARNMDLRVVVSERNDPDIQKLEDGMALLRKLMYRDAEVVTSNSLGVLDKMRGYVPAEKLKLLPNPVRIPFVSTAHRDHESRFVTVARLVEQKAIDLLLQAFASVAHELPGWHLDIVGDGPLYGDLVALAERLCITPRVTFHGYLEDPIDVLKSGRIFVLSSLFEGMPNALLEAMACGLAPIVNDASPGPLECVQNEKSGLIVPSQDMAALAVAMRRLAQNDELTDRLATNARNYVRAHEWSEVEPQWLSVLGIDKSPN